VRAQTRAAAKVRGLLVSVEAGKAAGKEANRLTINARQARRARETSALHTQAAALHFYCQAQEFV